jgi:hypothetical protein
MPFRTAAPGEVPRASLEALAEALVVRQSDPVVVRRAHETGGVPLAHWHKRERVEAGGFVEVGAGGRAELFFPAQPTSALFFDAAVVRLGDARRGEPDLAILELTRARLVLAPEDQIELPGGAQLLGDPAFESGPIVLERLRGDVLRVDNESKRSAEVRLFEERLALAPGESLDLPILPDRRAAPREADRRAVRVPGGEFAPELSVIGSAEAQSSSAGEPELVAREACWVRALGLRVYLAPGERARFAQLQPRLHAAEKSPDP